MEEVGGILLPIQFRFIPAPILIVSPHPDDDVLSSGGFIQKAVNSGKPVHIVYLTNGDANTSSVRHYLKAPFIPASFRRLGVIRHSEAVHAEKFLGVPQSRLYFFSFPDGYSLQIAESREPGQLIRSPRTLLDNADYPFAYRKNAPYTRYSAISMFLEVLRKVKPQTIIVNHPADTNPDHRAARALLFDALRLTKLSPVILSYLIHYPHWPSFTGPLIPPVKLVSNNVRSLILSNQERLRALRAFQLNRSQFNAQGRIVHLIRQNELFWLG